MSPEEEKGFPLEEEYKKNTLVSRQDIAKLRQWLETQPHLPAEAITELDLILTFHCCDHSAEVTKQVLDLNYTLRTLFSKIFKERVADEKMLASMRNVLYIPLETRAHDGSKILYMRLLDYDVKNFDFIETIRALIMVIDLWQYNEGSWPGFMMVVDLDGVALSYLARLDLQIVQQCTHYVQEAMLVKLKGLHFLGASSFLEHLMLILRPLIKAELLDLITIHQADSTTIDKFVPIEALPTDFESARDKMLSTVRNGADYFISENKKRVTESKRPGKPKTITDIFGGIEGSFKKLDID